MSLLDTYKTFLGLPTTSSLLLADEVSLHYIPTLTTVHGAAEVVKQLSLKELKKKEETVMNTVGDLHTLVLEIETTVEFMSGGGAYLPGLDGNFLTDRVAIFPVIHIVRFDRDQKIQQIRLHWDQGSLLKDLDVIGARSKAWPIYGGKDQARLIASSVQASTKKASELEAVTTATTEHKEAPRDAAAAAVSTTTTNGEHKKYIRDPHTSLSLFGPPEANPETPRPAAMPMRASAKPPPRDYHELFVGNESDASPSSAARSRSFSGGARTVEVPMSAKAGSGKHYQPSRLFEEENASQDGKPDEFVKPNPKKYQHFELGDGGEETDLPKASALKPKPNHNRSHWDFEDFYTPHKVVQKVRSQDVRHFGWGDDEAHQESPARPKRAVQPRRDAEAHFEFQDDGTPREGKRPGLRPKGSTQNAGLGLYENNVFGEDETGSSSPSKKQNLPLGNVTNINNQRQHFGSQFTMTDDSPGPTHGNGGPAVQKAVAADRRAAVKMMDSSWDMYDDSPEPSSPHQGGKKENVPQRSSGTLKMNGDGMGGRTGTQRQWGIGDESGGGEDENVLQERNPLSRNQKQHQQQTGMTGGGFWDF